MSAQKKIRILLVENIHPVAKSFLVEKGFEVVLEKTSPSPDQLRREIKNFDVVGIRSKTELREELLEANPHLLAIGAFCIGTNQIDLPVANRLGIPVFNAPYSNTRSVAELVISQMIALARQWSDRNREMHVGRWQKTAKACYEVRGKTIGIVGYGHIGSQLSILCESLGLRVIFYDIIKKLPLGNAKSTDSLDQLLGEADFVTLHVPETKSTHEMIGERELSLMKRGSFLINASRGTVVKIRDLAQALTSGHLGGAAIDVFPVEPEKNDDEFVSDLQKLPNVVLTPHIGGSTEEAQLAIGEEVSQSLLRFLSNGSSSGAVNFPSVDLPLAQDAHRLLNVHRNVPGVLKEINSIVSELGVNIQGQYLATDKNIGYLVMDMAQGQPLKAIEPIQSLPTSIRTRIL